MPMGLYNLPLLVVCFLSFLRSIPILVCGIWLSIRTTKTQCELIFIEIPLILSGVLLLLVSVCGLLGAQLRKKWLVWIFWGGVLVMMVLIFSFACLALNVSVHSRGGEVISGAGFKEYKLENYPNWLKKKVEKNWIGIKRCLRNRNVCESLSHDQDVNLSQFLFQQLSPIQSGCCRPPTQCGFVYKSPTTYDTTFSTSSEDHDCISWTNVDSGLCFDCYSCKAGVLENLKKDWRTVSIISFVCIFLLLILWSLTSAFIFFIFFEES